MTTPIACDMSTAEDTPEERVREYEDLFERALLRHERSDGAVVLSFRADPGVREQVVDLARRESACCPFLEYRVEAAAGEVIWTIANPVTGDERAAADAVLEAFAAFASRP
jgi:hypothetical protein